MKTFTRLLRVYSRRYPVAQARYHVPKAALLALLYGRFETGADYLTETQKAQSVEFAECRCTAAGVPFWCVEKIS